MTTFFELFDKFKRYLLVGAFNTVLNLSIMYVGASFGLHYLVYTPMGYLTTIVLSFFMNLRYTFKVQDRRGMRLLGFLLVSLTNLLIVEVLEYFLVEIGSFQRWIAVLVGMGWYVLAGFLVNNYVVYRHTKLKPESLV